MSQCPISAYLLLSISDQVPTPEAPVVDLSRFVIDAKLQCSKKPHPGDNEHQAYYGKKLFTWVFPEDTEGAEGS